MGHGHHHHHHHHFNTTKNLKTAFFLNAGFTIVEFIGGWYTGSLAILSDALHDLGDSFSLGLSWYFQKLSQKGATKRYTFGYKRFSLLGAFLNSMILFTGSAMMLYEAIPALWHPEEPDTGGMIFLAILGVFVNGAAVLKLKRGKSLNEKAVMTHLMEDVLGWIAVLVGAIVMHFGHYPIIDPLLSILIAIYILFNVFGNIKSAFKIVLQQVPEHLDPEELKERIKEVRGVIDVHDLHAWTMDGDYNVLTVHIVVKPSTTAVQAKEIKSRILLLLKTQHIDHVTLEFEGSDEECRENHD